MAIIISIKNLLKKFSCDIAHNVYRAFLRLLGYAIIILVIGFFGHSCTKAMTISDNLRTINETQLEMLENIYNRSNYKYYVISSEYDSTNYNNYTNYYLCLTNEYFDVSNPMNLNATCDKQYKYSYISGSYSLEELSDTELNLSNSIYYTNINNLDNLDIYILWGNLLVTCFIALLCVVNKILVGGHS